MTKSSPSKPTKQQGPFVNLCRDKAFKRYFKSNLLLLRSLLESFLPLPKGRKIQEIRVIDSAIEPRREEGKQSILDLKVKLDNQELVNVEMQVFPKRGFVRRALYYVAGLFTGFLQKGKNYTDIHPAYSLIFTGFDMFKDREDYIHSFSMRSDKPPFFRFSDDLSITVVELSKFLDKNPDNLVDMKALWCYLLKESGGMSMKEAHILAEKGEDMKQATDHLIHLSKAEKDMLYEEALLREEADRRAREDYVRDEGIEQGMQQGIKQGVQQGIEQGMQQGMEKGRQEEKEQLVLNMLREGADISFISKVSGWTKEKIFQLKIKD